MVVVVGRLGSGMKEEGGGGGGGGGGRNDSTHGIKSNKCEQQQI